MQVKRIADVPAVKVDMAGAEDVSVRVVFGPKDGAPTFALRQFELEPGGCTPRHTHPFEHEVLVMDGELLLCSENGDQRIGVGDAALIMPEELHQFRNPSETESAKMVCLVPVEYQS